MNILNPETNTSFLIISEIALSLYPQLIKLVDTNIETQTAIRFITYSILGIIGSVLFGTNILEFKNVSKYLIGGILNIVHVISSYSAFRLLSSGFSYTLFYTYPIFNLFARTIFFKEKINLSNYLYMIIAIIGVYLLTNKESQIEDYSKDDARINNDKYSSLFNDNLTYGILAGLLSALTESAIYLIVKGIDITSPFQNILQFYLFGGIISILTIIYYYLINPNTSKTTNKHNTSETEDNKYEENLKESKNGFFDSFNFKSLSFNIDTNQLITLVLFNSLVGFLGYVFRFFTIPRLTTLQFNTLIFLGVIFAYIWGYVFSDENIYLENIIGSLCILSSIWLITK